MILSASIIMWNAPMMSAGKLIQSASWRQMIRPANWAGQQSDAACQRQGVIAARGQNLSQRLLVTGQPFVWRACYSSGANTAIHFEAGKICQTTKAIHKEK
jgi:hypothetical protein